ncbi:hybrid sensor histidine kinase/response regulator [Collinsella tanakaei]|uniref:hybrid sensor histidine kinase/response regulator n=1 Tax=Collinsella tanakaei TaxID=626935 RepID=UPI0025A329AB|nr:hybrid sensor histidine kinase/response regulator [Collinsella tanakaei]MDM8301066.1 ATP-binding protein [Collinsella tanakaei]
MSDRARTDRDERAAGIAGAAAGAAAGAGAGARGRAAVPAGVEGSVRLLRLGVAGLLALCVAVFLTVSLFVMRSSDTTIDGVSGGFMEQMSAQIRLNFQSEIRLYRSELESVSLSAEIDEQATDAERRAVFVDEAERRGFRYVAILDGDDTSVLMGPELALDERKAFVHDTLAGDAAVTVGISDDGQTMIVLAEPLLRADGSGERDGDRVLVAGVPLTETVEALSLDVSATEVYTHIIRADGSFILNSNRSLHYDSYLELLRVNEGQPGVAYDITADRLKTIMDAGDSVFYVSNVNGERYASYLAPLEGTSWFIVSVLPFRVLHDPIDALAWNLFAAAAIGCVFILVVLAFVLTRYLKLLRAQMDALAEAREQADAASRAKSEFLSNMSHDIRTPMNAIVGMTKIARDDPSDEATVRRCLDTISTSSAHLLGLINDVLDMSRIESGRLEFSFEPARLTDIVRAAEGVIRPQTDARGQRFEVDVRDVVCDTVLVDRTRLGQVLINLLSNAVKFTSDGGCVTLAVEQEGDGAAVGFGAATGDGAVPGAGAVAGAGALVRTRLTVRDTGIGMSEEFQRKVFDSFEREDRARVHKTEGTGLGMAIVKRIVDGMGGTIEVSSRVGEGTCFTVVLDLACAPDAEAHEASAGEVSLDGLRVLLVEDNDINGEIACELLGGCGLEVIWVQDGRGAVDAFAASEPGAFAAILMDIRMPVMGGYDAARAIRALDRDDAARVPIIAMTADAFAEDIARARECGMDAHVAKPIDLDELLTTLRRCLAKGGRP